MTTNKSLAKVRENSSS